MNREILPLDRRGRNPLHDACRLLSSSSPPLVLFDVGANIGQTTGEMLNLWPKATIHSFEPFPTAYHELCQTYADSRGVHCHNLALGTKTEMANFHVNTVSLTNSLLSCVLDASPSQPAGRNDTPASTISVKVDTVDSICASERIEFIHLLKTDTQGTDLQVLKGAEQMIRSGRVPLILVEVLFVPLYQQQCWFEDVYRWLKEHGFQLVSLYNLSYDPTSGVAAWGDALFASPNSLAKMQIVPSN